MKETFLHYIWETRSYYAEDWATQEGFAVRIIDPGKRNHDQGPDFLHAHLEINGIEQYGHIEIHIDSPDWYRHGHQDDPNYNAVILHVVLNGTFGIEKPIQREDGTTIPEVSLNGRIHAGLMLRSADLDLVGNHPSCGPLLKDLPEAVRAAWMDRVATERLERKLVLAQAKLDFLQGDWEQAIWYDLAGFMAGPVNKESFQTLAEHLPVKILRKYQNNPVSREALLFGIACALVGEPIDPYMASLQSEWRYLSTLHQLRPAPILLKMHRMRPANFPTIRLAQLGVLISYQPRLTQWLYPEHLEDFCNLSFETPDYWKQHHRFGRTGRAAPEKIGFTTLRNILINCLRPFSILYARAHGDRKWEGSSREVTREIRPENNRYIRAYSKWNLKPENAEEGQAMIRLHQTYCQSKRCIECGIGKWVLGKDRDILSLPVQIKI